MKDDLYKYDNELYSEINILIINDPNVDGYNFLIVGYLYIGENKYLDSSDEAYGELDLCYNEAKRSFYNIMNDTEVVKWNWESGEFE